MRNHLELPNLTIKRILSWADNHKTATGNWPNLRSGQVTGTDETWLGIDALLRRGGRSLPSDSSLAKLLAEYRDARTRMDLPPLTVEQILAWADEHKEMTGEWPKANSGPMTGTDETWSAINYSLGAGRRGLPGVSSLAKLLKERRQ